MQMGFYERYHHTHLHPNSPPQTHFPSGPSIMYPQSINPPTHTSPTLHSQNPSPLPFRQYNSLLSQSFPTESNSSATSSEEDINIQGLLE